MAIAIVLTQVRAAVRVGLALNESHPTDATWESFLENPETQETLEELATMIQDLHYSAQAAGGSYTAMLSAVDDDHKRAFECLEPLCEKLGITPDDFFVTVASS
jgi:hypothetical protein